MNSRTAQVNLQLYWHILGFLLFAAAIVLIPSLVLAAAPPAVNTPTGNYICNVADNFEGSAGRGIATIGISVIGILALVGRITWVQAIIVGVGCAVLFGAPVIIEILGSEAECP